MKAAGIRIPVIILIILLTGILSACSSSVQIDEVLPQSESYESDQSSEFNLEAGMESNPEIFPESNPESNPEQIQDEFVPGRIEPLYDYIDIEYILSDKLPADLVMHIKEQRRNVFVEINNAGMELFKSWLSEKPDPETDERVAGIVRELLSDGPSETSYNHIAPDDALYEVDFLFDYLKCAYSGYGYFGGDAVFFAAKEAIIKEIHDNLSTDKIDIMDYNILLAKHIYPLVVDTHFMIGTVFDGHSFEKVRNLYAYSEELVFQKVNDSYVTILDDTEYTLVSIDDDDINRYIKATLLEDGLFGYVLGETQINSEVTKAISGSNISEWHKVLDVHLENNSGNRHFNVTLKLCKPFIRGDDHPIYFSYEKNGVMVMENTMLWPVDSPYLSNMNRPVEVSKFRNRNTVVLDVIGHNGGAGSYVYQWLNLFLRKQPSASYIIASKVTDTTRELMPSGWSPRADGIWEIETLRSGKIENDTVTFLLMGRNGSAGELWTGLLQHTDNVIMVGTNSIGSEFGNLYWINLPISGLMLQCSNQFVKPQDLSQLECVGYEPDLWVDPSFAMERVFLFIERYGLN